jgi:hypothetical protein
VIGATQVASLLEKADLAEIVGLPPHNKPAANSLHTDGPQHGRGPEGVDAVPNEESATKEGGLDLQ